MRRMTRAAIVVATLGAPLTGCTGLMTQQAVTAFSKGLEKKDLKQLKVASSPEFAQKALRLPESVQDFKLLGLPTGAVKVLSIDDKSPTERIAKVEIGSSKKPVEFHFTRSANGRRWVVSDVIQQAKTESKSGVSRSVQEEMDLWLSVRELIADWQSRDRDRVMACATPKLKSDMENLPPAWLEQVTQRMASDSPLRSFTPDGRMKDDRAVVKMSRPGGGELMLELHRADDRWLLNDASWKTGDENQVKSLSKLSQALTHARKFFEAYAADDKDALALLSTTEFHDSCLGPADLKQLPLPVMDLMTKEFDVRQHERRVDVLVTADDTTYTLNIRWDNAESDAPNLENQTPLDARVEEVTIYERQKREVKHLSAVFRSEGVVQYYSKMLANRDALQLKQLSSMEFNETVWRRFTPDVLAAIPIREIEPVEPKVISTTFEGPVTEVTVRQGSQVLVYVLNSESGRLVVDDVVMAVENRTGSLRKHLQMVAPIYEFADALDRGDRKALLATSGAGLNRIVWQQVQETPDIGVDILSRISAPVTAMKCGDTQSRVTLSDGQHVAEVELEMERGRYVVADVTFLDSGNSQPVAMLQAMRKTIARDMQMHNAKNILQAGHEEPADDLRRVQPL